MPRRVWILIGLAGVVGVLLRVSMPGTQAFPPASTTATLGLPTTLTLGMPATMALLMALLAATGTIARVWLLRRLHGWGGPLSLGLLLINVLGCLLAAQSDLLQGLVAMLGMTAADADGVRWVFVKAATGSLTTLSTLLFEVWRSGREGRPFWAAATLLVHVGLGVGTVLVVTGVLGATASSTVVVAARATAATAVSSTVMAWPWGTLLANLIGCGCFGLLWRGLQHRRGRWDTVRLVLLSGVLGAMTTLSSLAVEAAQMWLAGDILSMTGYLLTTCAGGLLLMSAGAALGRRLRIAARALQQAAS